jgi:hypothetical protein
LPLVRDPSGHIIANAVLMIIAGVFHALSCLSVLLNVVGATLYLPFFATGASSDAELTGNIIGFAWMGLIALAGVIWAPINAFGLFRRRPWARNSTLFYWAFVGIGCCCIPGAGYGIFALTRTEVVRAFARQP